MFECPQGSIFARRHSHNQFFGVGSFVSFVKCFILGAGLRHRFWLRLLYSWRAVWRIHEYLYRYKLICTLSCSTPGELHLPNHNITVIGLPPRPPCCSGDGPTAGDAASVLSLRWPLVCLLQRSSHRCRYLNEHDLGR